MPCATASLRSRAADSPSPEPEVSAERLSAYHSGVTVVRGFILQASYRVASRPGGARAPVIHLYGRLEDGRSFLVREDTQRPHFYIRAVDTGRARALRVPELAPSTRCTFDRSPVCRIETEVPPEVP